MVINGRIALELGCTWRTTKGGTYFGILGVEGNDVKRIEPETKNSWMQWSKPRSMEGHPVKYLHSDSQSWMSLLYGCKELPHLISWMGERPRKRFAYESSYWRVRLWSLCGPHGVSQIFRGNDTSCSRADQYGRKLRFKDFFRHPDVALLEGFKIPKFSKYNGVDDPYSHLLSFCGDCRGLDSRPGLFIHLYHQSLEGTQVELISPPWCST